MPAYDGHVTIWIKKEDRQKWDAIENKAEWLHAHLYQPLLPVSLGHAANHDRATDSNPTGIKSISWKGHPLSFTNFGGYAFFNTAGYNISEFDIEYEEDN